MKNLLLLIMCCLIAACTPQITKTPDLQAYQAVPIQSVEEATQRLTAANDNIQREIIKLTDNVYTAVGYDVSNITMIIGQDSIILVDAGMIPRLIEPLRDDFKKIADKPLAALIFTHSHGDHTGGSKVFIGDQNPAIWARDIHGNETRAAAEAGYVNKFRPVRQAGFLLEPEMRINNGLAIAVYPTPHGGPVKYTPGKATKPPKNFDVKFHPTHTFPGDSHKMTIDGIEIELYAAPGETDDQLFVWLPQEKVLCAGDNIYRAFPNLYAIRGTIYRDVNKWVQSLDKMLQFPMEHLVPGHTRPWTGAVASKTALKNYRDAIKFVFDKTIEGMNKGMTPDQLVQYVQLPDSLASLPYLQEYYGRIDWSVRNIHNGYLGWFDGNATNLSRLTPQQEAQKMAQLAGGKTQLLANAQQALSDKDFQWAAQLADHLLALNPDNTDVKLLKANALHELGLRQHNALARNYYLSRALQLRREAGEN